MNEIVFFAAETNFGNLLWRCSNLVRKSSKNIIACWRFSMGYLTTNLMTHSDSDARGVKAIQIGQIARQTAIFITSIRACKRQKGPPAYTTHALRQP